MPLTDKSYITLAEADAFWADRNDADWAALSEPEKTSALIRATEYIDPSFRWVGSVAEDTQKLAWPRVDAIDREGRLREGIPFEVKSATAWLAKHAATEELEPVVDQSGAIKRLKADVVEIEFTEGADTTRAFSYLVRVLTNLTAPAARHRDLRRV